MEDLERLQSQIAGKLESLKQERERKEQNLQNLNLEIKSKIHVHNELVSSVASLKKELKDKLESFSRLKNAVKTYKKQQLEVLSEDYRNQLIYLISNINSRRFEFKFAIFKDFDYVLSQHTENFPILNMKKSDLLEKNRISLKNKILAEIKECSNNSDGLENLTFYINFLIKFEKYFGETTMQFYISNSIEKEFQYHFMTERDSNRLDKPEWFIDFLNRKYAECSKLIKIYNDCSGPNPLTIEKIIKITSPLVLKKLHEISKTSSIQKRNLVLNFAIHYRLFCQEISDKYKVELDTSQLSHLLLEVQLQYAKDFLTETHQTNYIQWFEKYKELCKECISYEVNFGDLDQEFKLKIVIKAIIHHSRIFLENLRFINREEIKVAAYIFSEFEELKSFLLAEENDLILSAKCNVDELVSASVSKITSFNADVFKLIKTLAINDIQSTMKKIVYFKYAKSESKRTVLVEVARIIDDYKICTYFEMLETAILEEIDRIIFEEIIAKNVFSTDEYLEFKAFYKGLTKIVKSSDWKSDEACKCIDAIVENRTVNSPLFEKFSKMYGR